jgi:hypothetical protein
MSKEALFTQMIESTVSEILKEVGTSIPGHVLEFDPSTQLAKVQIGVVRIEKDGNTYEISPLINVPVLFPGGKYCVEYEIGEGDEGLIIISQRCIDAWKEEGGIASQPIQRKLDMQDALFIPGIRSKPGALGSFANNGIRLRNDDASEYIWLKSSGVEIKTAGDFDITSATATHNGVNIGGTHTHAPGTYTNSGGPVTGVSGAPTP